MSNFLIPEEFEYLFSRNPDIVKYPSTLLMRDCDKVEKIDANIKAVLKKMKYILLSTSGIGLAAPQIGENKRIIIVDSRVVINPEIIQHSREDTISLEGCLSIPGLWGEVKRSSEIRLKGLNAKGEDVLLNMRGREAIISQHEIDHLNGLMFFEKASPSSLRWEHPE